MNQKLVLIRLFLALQCVRATAQTADQWVAQGRANLVSSNLSSANVCFSNAVARSPTDAEANVLYAATRLLVLPNQPSLGAFLTRLGFGAAGRSLYDWTAKPSKDTNGSLVLPPGVNANEFTALLRTNLAVQLAAADANLAIVTDPGFVLKLAAAETTAEDVTLDYGDVLMLRALLHAGEYLDYTASSINLDVMLTDAEGFLTNKSQGIAALLTNYPTLFTFATTSDFAVAQQAFAGGADLYNQASAFIRNRPANGNRLFNFDPDMVAGELRFRESLADVAKSLASPVVLRWATNDTVNLARQFNPANAPRNWLPAFSGSVILAGTFPDPTFGGIITGLTVPQIDHALGGKIRYPDARGWVLTKGQLFTQTGSGAPVLLSITNGPGPYMAHALVVMNESASIVENYVQQGSNWVSILTTNLGSVTNATLTLPTGVKDTLLVGGVGFGDLNTDQEYDSLSGDAFFNSQSDLDAFAPDGVYSLTFSTVNSGVQIVSLKLTGDGYPSVPHISNGAAAQCINPAQDFTLTWDPLAGGATNDFIQLKIEDAQEGYEVWTTPDFWEYQALDGTATSAVIPQNTLAAGRAYTARLLFVKPTASAQSPFPGARGGASYFRQTFFTMRATDIGSIALAKGQQWNQTGAGALALADSDAFFFNASVDFLQYYSGTNVTLRLPNGTLKPMSSAQGNYVFESFNTQAALDAAYPDGQYTFTIHSSLFGYRTNTLSLSGNYPTTPQINDYAAAQAINGAADFALTWNPFAGGTVGDFVQVTLGSSYAFDYGPPDITNSPNFGTPGALNGTATGITIGANTLYAQQTDLGTLEFVKLADSNTTYPGAKATASYSKTTSFQIQSTTGLQAPDLAVTSFTVVGAVVLGTNNVMTVSITVTNQGSFTAKSGWSYGLYMATGPTADTISSSVNFWNNQDPNFWGVEDHNLAPGETITHTFEMEADPNFEWNRFLILILDDPGYDYSKPLIELSKANNTDALLVPIPGPDLRPIAFSTPSTGRAGQTVPISFTVINQGTMGIADGAIWSDGVYLSTSSVYEANAVLLIDVPEGQALPLGTTYTTTISIDLPQTPGLYYLILNVNDQGDITESDPTNNTLVAAIQVVSSNSSSPLILSQPQSVVVSPGQSANFSVVADGPALIYQWWHGGVLLPGATQSAYVLPSALPGAQGAYSVVVSNAFGSVTSAVATLAFNDLALTILTQPMDTTVESGSPATFYVLASGVPNLTYQWLFNGTPILFATNATLRLPAVSSSSAGWYSVIVTNDYRALTSSTASLTVTGSAKGPQIVLGRLPGGLLSISFTAEAQTTYRLLSSTDLAAWSPVATNSTPTAGPLQFVRSILAQPKTRVFYRVATP